MVINFASIRLPMKLKLLFLLLFASTVSVSQAQSLQILNADTLVIEEEAEVLAQAHAQVKNISNATVRVLVTRELINLNSNHDNYFCWGVNCYGPPTSQSPDTLPMESNSVNNTFKGYIDAGGFIGNSVVKYCFINSANLSDRSCFTARYQMGLTSVAGGEPGKAVPVPAMYDANSQTIRINNVNGGKIEIWNMIGQKVDLNWRSDGSAMVADASSLKPGYYFLFGNSENKVWSARVMVTK